MTAAMQPETVDGPNTELAVVHAPTAVNLFGVEDPAEVITRATAHATALAKVVESRGLIKDIAGKRYPLVEAWTMLGSMVGVFPVCVWTRKLEDGWEARVEARTLSGNVVGAAEASCLRGEKRWKTADDYAVRSMAQTRATAKALRMPLGFIVTLAGYSATPAEEVPGADATSPDSWPAMRAKLTRIKAGGSLDEFFAAAEISHLNFELWKAMEEAQREDLFALADEYIDA